jgi:hypothetical protein
VAGISADPGSLIQARLARFGIGVAQAFRPARADRAKPFSIFSSTPEGLHYTGVKSALMYSASIEIVAVTPARMSALHNLFQFDEYDFSEIEAT